MSNSFRAEEFHANADAEHSVSPLLNQYIETARNDALPWRQPQAGAGNEATLTVPAIESTMASAQQQYPVTLDQIPRFDDLMRRIEPTDNSPMVAPVAPPVTSDQVQVPQDAPAAAPQMSTEDKLRTAMQIANDNFISQEPTQWNPNAPAINNDCGPAVLAMIMKLTGKLPAGFAPQQAENIISQMRQEMTGRDDHRSNTDDLSMARVANRHGLQVQNMHDMNDIDQALSRGGAVAVLGASRSPGSYIDRLSNDQYYKGDPNARRVPNHFSLIVAKDSAGNYIIDDPLSKVGSILASRNEIQSFIAASHATARTGIAYFS